MKQRIGIMSPKRFAARTIAIAKGEAVETTDIKHFAESEQAFFNLHPGVDPGDVEFVNFELLVGP